jgi:hypothetical protein
MPSQRLQVLNVSQESKAFAAQSSCSDLHAPCAQGRQYPPGLQAIVAQGKAFSGATGGAAYEPTADVPTSKANADEVSDTSASAAAGGERAASANDHVEPASDNANSERSSGASDSAIAAANEEDVDSDPDFD